MALALELAHRITSQRFADLPPQAVHWAKVGILDTVGTTLAGCHEDTACLAARALASGAGPSLLFGYSRRVPALEAALVNGAASHALDFDDCNNTIGGHPSAPVLSALFALADDIGASGQDFMTAYVMGFETETKIGLGVNMDHYTKGWHPTATLGVFGAAAACASLLRLSAAQTATALAIAASFASGIKANFGTMMKPLHVGHCARNGLYAALLAREGYTANTASAFEHKQGFFQVFNGTGNYDAARILPAWAHPWDIVDPGIAIKQYPCCGSTHPAIDALLLLLRVHDLQPAQVARLEAWIHERRLEHTNRPDPQSALDAKFSLQYCLARALLDRQVIIEHFEGDTYTDAAIRRLLPRIQVAPYTTAQFPADNHFGAEVRVTLGDGTVLTQKVDQPFGRTSRNPLPPAQLREKFMHCVRAARAARDAGDGTLRRDPAPGTEPQCPRGDCADRVARAAQHPPRACRGGTGLMTVNITHAAVVAIGARGTRDPRCSRRAASRSTGECRDDVRIARRYSYEKAGFAARFGAIEVDALHKEAMEMEV